MKTNLTDTAIKAITPPKHGYGYYSDSKHPGLKLRVNVKGAKVWVVQKQIKGGRRIFVTLGSYPAVTLKAAREQAFALHAEAEAGIDRIEAGKKMEAEKLAKALANRSVEQVLNEYIATHIEHNLKPGQARKDRVAQLRTHLAPHANQSIASVTRIQLQAVIDAKLAEGKPTMANRIRAAFTAFFNWAEGRGYIETNPADRIQKAAKEKPRSRTPSVEEVREIWLATYHLGPLWGAYFRFCILTGQRSRSDVAQMRWEWIDWGKSRYCIPDPKNGQPHVVHLSVPAIKELKSLPGAESTHPTGWVFSTTGTSPISGFAKTKARLDIAINKTRGAEGRQPMQDWRIHDLRRAQATALAETGVDEGVVDRIQNHVAATSRASAVAAVYNRAQRLPERARALDQWADMVLNTAN